MPKDGGDPIEPGPIADILRIGLQPDALVAAVMQLTGMTEENAREMIAIETGEPDGDVRLEDHWPGHAEPRVGKR